MESLGGLSKDRAYWVKMFSLKTDDFSMFASSEYHFNITISMAWCEPYVVKAMHRRCNCVEVMLSGGLPQ